MPKKNLTDRFVNSAKPNAGKWAEYWDEKEPGLLLIVSPKGHKSFAFRYRSPTDGKKRKITIGPAADKSLKDARAAAAGYRSQVGAGEDPAREIRNAKRANKTASTFEDLAKLYMKRHAKPNKKSWKEDQRILDHDVLPAIGEMKIGDIRKRDVLDIIDAVADRGSPIMANRTLAVVRGIFRWAEAEDFLEQAPVHGIRPRAVEITRDRVLDLDEIRTFWASLGAASITPQVADVLRLVLILGQRVSEVTGARIEELKLDDGEWNIPASRTKNGRAHSVPLPALAIEIFERNIRPESNFVFSSRGVRGHLHPQGCSTLNF